MPSNTMNFSACTLEVLLLTAVVLDWFCIVINFCNPDNRSTELTMKSWGRNYLFEILVCQVSR